MRDDGGQADLPVLQLRSRLRPIAGLSVALTAVALVIVIGHFVRQTPLGLADGIFVGLLVAAATLTLVWSLFPVTLRADAFGIHWRQFGYRKTFLWNEIEAIGIGRDTAFDGYDRPAVRILVPHSTKLRRTPCIGINLKVADRNAATVSYRRSVTGYELNFPHVFDAGLTALVTDLQTRLDAARRRLGSAA